MGNYYLVIQLLLLQPTLSYELVQEEIFFEHGSTTKLVFPTVADCQARGNMVVQERRENSSPDHKWRAVCKEVE